MIGSGHARQMPFSNFPLSPNINRPDLTDDNWNQHGFFDEIECEGLGYEFEGHRHCDDGRDYSASHSDIGHVYESDSQLFSGYFRDSVHDDYYYDQDDYDNADEFDVLYYDGARSPRTANRPCDDLTRISDHIHEGRPEALASPRFHSLDSEKSVIPILIDFHMITIAYPTWMDKCTMATGTPVHRNVHTCAQKYQSRPNWPKKRRNTIRQHTQLSVI